MGNIVRRLFDRLLETPPAGSLPYAMTPEALERVVIDANDNDEEDTEGLWFWAIR